MSWHWKRHRLDHNQLIIWFALQISRFDERAQCFLQDERIILTVLVEATRSR